MSYACTIAKNNLFMLSKAKRQKHLWMYFWLLKCERHLIFRSPKSQQTKVIKNTNRAWGYVYLNQADPGNDESLFFLRLWTFVGKRQDRLGAGTKREWAWWELTPLSIMLQSTSPIHNGDFSDGQSQNRLHVTKSRC
jgi:hypothetical protein